MFSIVVLFHLPVLFVLVIRNKSLTLLFSIHLAFFIFIKNDPITLAFSILSTLSTFYLLYKNVLVQSNGQDVLLFY